MPFEVHRVNHECKTCKNKTTFKTPKGYFCRECLEVEPYADKETKVEIMQDNVVEEKPVEQITEIHEAIVVEPSQQSIEDVSEES